MEATWALATRKGPMSVTMSQVAQDTGIGRSTLYKYFPDVESILHARHERHVLDHLGRLNELKNAAVHPARRLEAVAAGYAQICHHRARDGAVELSEFVHQPERVRGADKRLVALFEALLAEAVAAGVVRDDTAVEELAIFCVHALGAARSVRSNAAVRRLVSVTLAALTPTHA